MKEKLDRLVRVFKEEKVVEHIVEADIEIKVEAYEKEKMKFIKQLNDFKEEAELALKEKDYTWVFEKYDITPENVLEIWLICSMIKMSPNDLMENHEDVFECLKKIGRPFDNFFMADEGFTDCLEKEILSIF